jgi:hypothetical protein
MTAVTLKNKRSLPSKPSALKRRKHRKISVEAATTLCKLSKQQQGPAAFAAARCVSPLQEVSPVVTSVQNSNRKKKVRFSDMCNVKLKPVCEKDLYNSWYRGSDYFFFEKDRRRSIAAISLALAEGRILHPALTSGLEHDLSRTKQMARKYRTAYHAYLVLKQQHLQRRHGYTDPKELRSVSKLSSISHNGIQPQQRWTVPEEPSLQAER